MCAIPKRCRPTGPAHLVPEFCLGALVQHGLRLPVLSIREPQSARRARSLAVLGAGAERSTPRVGARRLERFLPTHRGPPYAICIQHMRRAASRQWVLKPQDLAVALKLTALKGRWLPYAALGEAMRLSRFEAHAAVHRLGAAGLVADAGGSPQPVMAALRSFILSGARYAYPPVRGATAIGFPTAQSMLAVKKLIVASPEPVSVWPHPEGKLRGQSLLALYDSLPLAAMEDRDLYESLALFDLLRIGHARERGIAHKLLEERLQ